MQTLPLSESQYVLMMIGVLKEFCIRPLHETRRKQCQFRNAFDS